MLLKGKTLLSVALAAALLTGCATTELQTKSKLTKTVVLDHSTKENKNIYVQVTNTAGSGGENMQLAQSLKNKLQAKGYKIVTSSKDASYGLFVNVLFANNLTEAHKLSNSLALGGTIGTSARLGGAGGSDALAVGVAVALGSAIIGKALEDDVFRAVTDIRIRDYSEIMINTVRTEGDTGGVIVDMPRSGTLNQFAGQLGSNDGAGDMSSGISESTTTQTQKNYEEYRTRGFVEATKMNLKLEEALPILEDKLTRQITNLF